MKLSVPTSRLGRINPGKEALYPLSKKLGGAQSQFGHCKEQKNVLTVPGFESLIVQPIFSTYLAVRRKTAKITIRITSYFFPLVS